MKPPSSLVARPASRAMETIYGEGAIVAVIGGRLSSVPASRRRGKRPRDGIPPVREAGWLLPYDIGAATRYIGHSVPDRAESSNRPGKNPGGPRNGPSGRYRPRAGDDPVKGPGAAWNVRFPPDSAQSRPVAGAFQAGGSPAGVPVATPRSASTGGPMGGRSSMRESPNARRNRCVVW